MNKPIQLTKFVWSARIPLVVTTLMNTFPDQQVIYQIVDSEKPEESPIYQGFFWAEMCQIFQTHDLPDTARVVGLLRSKPQGTLNTCTLNTTDTATA